MMSKLIIIVSPLTDPNKVKEVLQSKWAGKEIVVSADPFSEEDVVITPYDLNLSRQLSGETLDRLLDQKDILVQSHAHTDIGAHVSELMSDEKVDASAVSRTSSVAFAGVGFANQLAKLNNQFVITTGIQHDFGEDVAIKEWFERAEQEEQIAATTKQAITQDIPEPLAKIDDGNTTDKEVTVSDQPAVVETEEAPKPTAEPEEVKKDLSDSPSSAPTAETPYPRVDEVKVETDSAKIDFLAPIAEQHELQGELETAAEVAVDSVSLKESEVNGTQTDALSNETFFEQPVLKQPVDSQVEKAETTSTQFDDFDPLAAFKNSVEVSKTIEAGEELPKEEKKKEEAVPEVYIGKLPDYPKVNTTVEILTHPLTLKEFDPEEAPGKFFDWAGHPNRLNEILEIIDNKIEESERYKRRPNLTEHEVLALGCMDDRIGSPVTMERMFVEDSKWSQALRTETNAIPIITIVKNPKYGDHRYVGDDAVSLIANRMKIGVTVGVFLPHTGLYFLIISPSDEELMNTLSIINAQRIDSLRSSSGILLGNSNYYLNKQVINLFLDSITDCSLTAFNRETIYELLDDRDVDIMSAALQASISPDGYDYHQVCGLELENKPNQTCQGSQEFLVDLKRMVFVDNSRLNEYQRIIATGGLTKRSLKEIEDYQAQHYLGWSKPYEITEGVEFKYKASTAAKSIEAGEKWITEISKVVDRLIAFKQDETERNVMIDQRVNITRIREFTHWVEDIIVDGLSLTDRDKIEALLSRLSRNPKVVNRVSETLAEFQRQSLIAMVAIPRVQCPTCQQTDKTDIDISTYLIPQDATSRFFTLARQRLS